LKKFILILISIISIIFICNISYSQESPDYSTFFYLLIGSEYVDIESPELTVEEVNDLIDELSELLNIPDDKKTTENWKRIVDIILIVVTYDFEYEEEIIKKIDKLIKENEHLINLIEDKKKELDSLHKEKDKLLLELDSLIQENTYYIDQLGILQQQYDSLLLKLDTHKLGITGGIRLPIDYSVGIYYMYDFGMVDLGFFGKYVINDKRFMFGISIGLGF